MHVIHHDNSGEQTAYINEFTHMVNNPKSIEYYLGCRKEGWMIKIFKRKRKKHIKTWMQVKISIYHCQILRLP